MVILLVMSAKGWPMPGAGKPQAKRAWLATVMRVAP
jgi:hypothetical protein